MRDPSVAQVELAEQLKDHLRVVTSARDMMRKRQTAQQNTEASRYRLEGAKQRATQAGSGRDPKVESAVMEAQAQADSDEKELMRITRLCLAEAKMFREEKKRLRTPHIHTREYVQHTRTRICATHTHAAHTYAHAKRKRETRKFKKE